MINISCISDENYLTYGLSLRDSIASNTKEDFIIHYLALDEKTEKFLSGVDNIKVYTLDVIENDPDFQKLKENNPSKPGDLSPFHWALASFFSYYLMENENIENCIYSDTDICFYGDIKDVIDSCKIEAIDEECDVGLITHKHVPLDYMQSVGYYNVGIIYFNGTEKALKCLKFWRDCVVDKNNIYAAQFGSCGDQKYLELFEHVIDGIQIMTLDVHIGHAAPWNFSLSRIENNKLTWDMGPAFFDSEVNGEHELTHDLLFVHFSHFTPDYENDSYEIDFNFEETPKGRRPAWGNILPQPGVKEVYDNYFELCKNTRKKYGITK